jgi:hypothetical protein
MTWFIKLIVSGILAWIIKKKVEKKFASAAWWSNNYGTAVTATFLVSWFAILFIFFPTVEIIISTGSTGKTTIPVKIDPATGKALPVEVKKLDTWDRIIQKGVMMSGNLMGYTDSDGDRFPDSQELILGWNPNVYTIVE